MSSFDIFSFKILIEDFYYYHGTLSTVVFEFCTFQMSKSGIRRKHIADAIQLRRISHLASPTYKEGPSGRANGRATHNAYKKRYQGPYVSLPEKDKDERRPGGAGRLPGSAEPGREASRPGAFQGGVTPKSPNHLPYMHLAGTDLH